jgi:hypothetical protein
VSALSPADLAVLDLLRHDRDECGDGVSLAEIEQAGSTRWPGGILNRLRAAGFVWGRTPRFLYQLGFGNDTESGCGNPHPPGEAVSFTPGDADSAPALSAELTLFPSPPSVYREAA